MALVAAFYSCQRNDVTIGSSSITSDGIVSGTIVNDSNRIDSVKAYYVNLIGKSVVSSDGKFSIVLSTPVLYKIGTFPIGVVVSDTTAMTESVSVFDVDKGGVYIGYIGKSNYGINDIVKIGRSTSIFLYSDRGFTIKGTYIQTNTSSTGIIQTLKMNYNIIFKKGWNEVVLKLDSYSTTSTTSTAVETYSNTVTSDLQWRYYPYYNPYAVRAKACGLHGVARQGFLFR